MKTKSVKKNIIYNYIKTFMSLLFPYITFSYISRVLGVEAVGKINYSRSIVEYFVILGSLGIVNYGTREGARIRDDKRKLSQLAQELFIINLVAVIISYGLFLVLCFNVKKLYSYRLLCMIYSSSIILQSLGMEWLYSAEEEYRYIAIRSIVVQMVSLLALFLFVRKPTDVVVYAIINVFATSGIYIVNLIGCRQFISFRKMEPYKFKKHIGPIMVLFGFAISTTFSTTLDSTMLGYLKGDTSVGLYSTAVKTNKMIARIITCIGTVLVPRLAYYCEIGNRDKFEQLVEKAYSFVFLLSFPLCLLAGVLSRPIVYILSGAEFEQAVLTAKILTPIIIFISFNVLTCIQIMIPLKMEKLVLLSTVVEAVVNFILNAIFIPRWAENGAAVATVITEGLVAAICYYNASKLYDIRRFLKRIYIYFIAALPIIPIGLVVQKLINNIYLASLVIVICAMVEYIGVLLVIKDKNMIMIVEYFLGFFQKFFCAKSIRKKSDKE